ncbi:MAG: ATP-binding cassette domain-containing protein, partial [Candidatus Omnitrophica bacterium]|nr:ATP-binding cassette domain-containing protein [Candidatus Omnitrophota bacterium]
MSGVSTEPERKTFSFTARPRVSALPIDWIALGLILILVQPPFRLGFLLRFDTIDCSVTRNLDRYHIFVVGVTPCCWGETLEPLLRVKNLKMHFPIRSGVFSRVVDYVRAVDGVTFDIFPGETLGLAGESGCGKTTVGRTILRLLDGGEGEVYFGDSPNLLTLSQREMRPYRKDLQIIFQDPFSSLNPRLTVGSTLMEPLKIFGIGKNGAERRERAAH